MSQDRNKKVKTKERKNEFEMIEHRYDKHIDGLKEFMEDARQALNNKNSSQHQKFMQELALKVQPPHYNAFSHENKKFKELAIEKTQTFKLATQLGMQAPSTTLKCSNIKFEQFVLLNFKDDVPQFITTLFKFLTGTDLRELLKPIACQNQFSKQIKSKNNKKKNDLLAQRYNPMQLV